MKGTYMSKSNIYEALADLQWCGQSFAAGDEVTGDALAGLMSYGVRFVSPRKSAPTVSTPTNKATGPTTQKEA